MEIVYSPVDTGHKLKVHKTFRRRLGRLLNVLCTFNLRPVSTGSSINLLAEKIENTWNRLHYFSPMKTSNPAGIYMLKVNKRNIRTRCEIWSKLIKGKCWLGNKKIKREHLKVTEPKRYIGVFHKLICKDWNLMYFYLIAIFVTKPISLPYLLPTPSTAQK